MNMLLKHDFISFKECAWQGYFSDIVQANSSLEENGFKAYPSDLNWPKCGKHIISLEGN